MKSYDIIIIGSGGGSKLRPASDLGKTIAIIEDEALGGTCLNKGCIPSKMLIYPSDLATHAREDAKHLHINGLEKPSIDWKALVEDTTAQITADSDSIEPAYEKNPNVTLYKGFGKFVSDKVIEVNGEQITAEKIYVATGSQPSVPPIPGLEGTPFMTSKQALRNTNLPKKMIVIGGGYIAVELGHVYAAAGCDVHFLVRSGMIKAEDKDIREAFEKDFSNRYNVHFGISPSKVEYKNNTFYITIVDKEGSEEIMESDGLFVATGVFPMSGKLGLENTSITTDKRGYIEVNDHLETKASGVYALGDVIGKYLFRHSVNYEGEYLLAQHYRGAKQSPIKYPPVPHAIFSYPQIAGVGVTEDQLIKDNQVEGKDYEIAIHNYKNSAMGSAMKAEVGFVKLIADKQTGVLIGAHILGEKSSDLIHMLIVLVSDRKPVSFMLDSMIFIHPALAEVIRNAARKLQVKLSS
ncbi:dihydrolipoyl dehydrogenase [Candidatus Gracilibacteria bacterium]|nr:dihydrolipoyl dehydrogenase [Candidatus Gracilibacteria bacterium]